MEQQNLKAAFEDGIDYGYRKAIRNATLCVCRGWKQYMGAPPLDRLCVKCGGLVIWKLRQKPKSNH